MCFEGIPRKLQGGLKDVSSLYKGSFRYMLRACHVCFDKVPRVFQVWFKGGSSRGEPNRGYKQTNPNSNILSLVFVSHNRIRIV